MNNKSKTKTDKSNTKLFGIKLKDIPKGHPLRIIYPNKFK